MQEPHPIIFILAYVSSWFFFRCRARQGNALLPLFVSPVLARCAIVHVHVSLKRVLKSQLSLWHVDCSLPDRVSPLGEVFPFTREHYLSFCGANMTAACVIVAAEPPGPGFLTFFLVVATLCTLPSSLATCWASYWCSVVSATLLACSVLVVPPASQRQFWFPPKPLALVYLHVRLFLFFLSCVSSC